MKNTTKSYFANLKLLTLVFGLLVSNLAVAQPVKLIDATFGQGKKISLASFSYGQLYNFGVKKRLIAGFGFRLNDNFGSGQTFVTAPAKVSEGNFLKKQNEAKLDTLVLQKHNVASLNGVVFLGYQLNKKISLEFNIDALGVSFGGEQTGSFQAKSQQSSAENVKAKPTKPNLLLTGDYDWGSLNSELVVNIKLTDKLSLKAGTAFVFTEYTTTKKLTFNNDRFRNKSLLPAIGFRVKL